MRRSAWLSLLVALGLTAAPATAWADGTYHTARIVLHSVDDSARGHGVVINAHANGPTIYAHEQYQLRAATPNTSFQVTLHVYVLDPDCSDAEAFTLPSDVLMTNMAGNANGSHMFVPADTAGLQGTHGVIWTMTSESGEEYASSCQAVTLD